MFLNIRYVHLLDITVAVETHTSEVEINHFLKFDSFMFMFIIK